MTSTLCSHARRDLLIHSFDCLNVGNTNSSLLYSLPQNLSRTRPRTSFICLFQINENCV